VEEVLDGYAQRVGQLEGEADAGVAPLPQLDHAHRAVRVADPPPHLLQRQARGRYWDGLFSQNPPVKNFIAGREREGKPEEIWVVQLNPQEIRKTPRSVSQIEDRRNELAGTLSLNQEADTVEAVNGWLTDGTFASHGRDRYRPVGVHRVVMDSSALEPRWTMDRASKLDRDPAFLWALIAQGEALAELFLPARAFIEGVWNEQDRGRRRAAAERLSTAAGGMRVFELVEALHRDFAPLRVDLKDMDIKLAADSRRRGPCGEVTLKAWTARGKHRRSDQWVTLAGSGRLEIAGGKIVGGGISGRVEKINGPAGAATALGPG
jgi:hypothetical protein